MILMKKPTRQHVKIYQSIYIEAIVNYTNSLNCVNGY